MIRTKRKSASLILKFPDIFGPSFVLSDCVFPQRLGLGLVLGYMYHEIYRIPNNHYGTLFRTQCIPAELAWSGATDGLE